MRTKQDYKNLLEETVQYYIEDTNRRAVTSKGDCMYLTEDNRKCAVGRCLKEPEYTDEGEAVTERILKDLKEEYKGYDIDFWEQLQELHDWEGNWNHKGLTKAGENKKQMILNWIEKHS